jgi:hypothetical protein
LAGGGSDWVLGRLLTLRCVTGQVGNAIGKGNRHYFIIFLWLELYGMATSAVIACVQIHKHVHASSWSTSELVRAWLECKAPPTCTNHAERCLFPFGIVLRDFHQQPSRDLREGLKSLLGACPRCRFGWLASWS